MPALVIDIFSDVVCPWCFVGAERIERVLASLAPAPDVEIVHHPFMLMPGTPAEGMNVHDWLRRRYGPDLRRAWSRVEAEAREEGIDLDLSRQAYAYQTLRAHVLLRHAAAKGTQHALNRALFRAYFLDVRDISDAAVLSDVAAPYGFTADEVRRLIADEAEIAITREECEAAMESAIRGVPFFVFNNKFAISGAQPAEVFRAAVNDAISTPQRDN